MIDNPLEWFQEEITKLASHSPKTEILSEMKSFVINSEKSILRDIIHNVSIIPLFEYLNTSISQDIDIISIILYELLSQLEAMKLLKDYGTWIDKLFFVNSDEAKIVALKLLKKNMNNNTIEYLFSKQLSLIINALECLASEERGLAQNAILAFIKLGKTESGLLNLYSTSMLDKFKEIMSRNATTRFRVYEIIVAISKESPQHLSLAISNGFMEKLVSEVHSSDILIQLNGLEVLSSLATCNHGLNYLMESNGMECNVVQVLINKLLKIEEEPLSLMLLPGLIEFFGNICIQQPENFAAEYPQIMNLLFTSLENSDQVLSGIIISTVCKIGSTYSGRLVLLKYNKEINDFLKKMAQFLVNKNDLTVNILNSLCELLKELNGNKQCNEVTEKWFDALGSNAITTIISYAKLPFVEFKLSALSLLKTIAKHEWGSKKLCNFPGMIEYLLDRTSEFNKECKEIKYDIVFNIFHCSNVTKLIPPENLLVLNEFLKEGPFFVSSQVETATEGAN